MLKRMKRVFLIICSILIVAKTVAFIGTKKFDYKISSTTKVVQATIIECELSKEPVGRTLSLGRFGIGIPTEEEQYRVTIEYNGEMYIYTDKGIYDYCLDKKTVNADFEMATYSISGYKEYITNIIQE